MASVDLYTPIKGILDKFGSWHKVYTVAAESVACPCTNNPYHQYSLKWHLDHPDAPNCHQTGMLAGDGGDGYFDVESIWGVCLPNYSFGGVDSTHTIAGLLDKWAWLGITQEDKKFNRWINARGMIFKVESEMPYYLSGSSEGVDDKLTVAMYGLSLLNSDVRIV